MTLDDIRLWGGRWQIRDTATEEAVQMLLAEIDKQRLRAERAEEMAAVGRRAYDTLHERYLQLVDHDLRELKRDEWCWDDE